MRRSLLDSEGQAYEERAICSQLTNLPYTLLLYVTFATENIQPRHSDEVTVQHILKLTPREAKKVTGLREHLSRYHRCAVTALWLVIQ